MQGVETPKGTAVLLIAELSIPARVHFALGTNSESLYFRPSSRLRGYCGRRGPSVAPVEFCRLLAMAPAKSFGID